MFAVAFIASADVGHDGTGTYRLTMAHTPGPITVSPGDEGGPLTNGAMHTGEIPLVFENDHWPAAPDRAFGSPKDTKIRALRVDLDETDII